MSSKPAVPALLLAISLTTLLSACKEEPATAAAPPPKVGVITLQSQAQTLTSALAGRTSAFMSADIRPQINGIVQKRLFTEGAMVKAGQPLYQIDAAPYQAAEAAAKAALATVAQAAGAKPGQWMPVLRIALSGRAHGPDLGAILDFLGSARCAARLRAFATKLPV